MIWSGSYRHIDELIKKKAPESSICSWQTIWCFLNRLNKASNPYVIG